MHMFNIIKFVTAPINYENDYMLLPRKMSGEIAVEQLTIDFAKMYFRSHFSKKILKIQTGIWLFALLG